MSTQPSRLLKNVQHLRLRLGSVSTAGFGVDRLADALARDTTGMPRRAAGRTRGAPSATAPNAPSRPPLQQHRPQELLRRDRRATDAGVERREVPLHRRQRLVHEQPDRPRRMIPAHPLFEINVAEQRSSSLVRSPQINLPRRGD